MKTITSILALLFVLNITAQEQKFQERKQQFTPEQIAELQTKKMDLDFELNDKQRKELYKLNLENAKQREAKREALKELKSEQKTLTSDEKYEMQLKRLDEMKKHQSEMKRILGEGNYKAWKEKNAQRQMNIKNAMRHKRVEVRKNRYQKL